MRRGNCLKCGHRHSFLFPFNFFIYIAAQQINNVLIISSFWWIVSAIYVYIHVSNLPKLLSHPGCHMTLGRVLCYTVGLCCGEGSGNPLQHSCLETPMDGGAWWAAVHGVTESQTRLSDFTFTFHCHALEKEMATHSSVLAWRISGTGEPGGLPSMGSHRVRHGWSDLAVVVPL